MTDKSYKRSETNGDGNSKGGEDTAKKRKKLIEAVKEAKLHLEQKNELENGHNHNHESKELVGPRGGTFKESDTGKKRYDIKKSLIEYLKFLDASQEVITKQKTSKGLV